MYLNFFDLKKEPFQITPDPSFLYLSPGHKEALASIIYGVEKKKGFVLIIGAVGVGKTTILRAYLEKIEKEQLRVIYLFNANISYINLLKYIFRELSIVPESTEISDMVTQLNQILIDEYKEGRNVLLLIDEAQNMPLDTLENLRMLSNLETANDKLIQIVFSGQPEFEKTLNLDELRQLKQRIAVKAIISPLTEEEGLTYIQHRLKRASEKDSVIFSRTALHEIVKCSGGIPRLINVLCDNCLITAFGYGKRKVGISVVKEITRDFGMRKRLGFAWPMAVTLTFLLVVAGVYFSYTYKASVFSFVRPSMDIRNMALPHFNDVRPIGRQEPRPSPTKTSDRNEGAVSYVERKVVRGDTLARLILDVYGRVDPKMIKLVKKANPHIADENLIIEGGSIVFPVTKGK